MGIPSTPSERRGPFVDNLAALAALAERYLQAVESGDRFAHARGLELAEAVLKASEAGERVAGEGAERLFEQGRVQGRREMLLLLLELRFGKLPNELAERVATAASEQIDAWAEGLVASGSLEEILAELERGSK